jgi:uncharacterized protein (TIGR00730 family)
MYCYQIDNKNEKGIFYFYTMEKIKSVAVYCGSSSGNNPIYEDIAYQTGRVIAEKGMRLVYGGAKVGLMGQVANGALHHDAQVIGVIPHFLKSKEIVHEELTKLFVVDSMHERKHKMYESCDAFIALPGGFGTMEELFEMLTWGQLGLHQKPIGVLNVNGFYDALLMQADKMVQEGFMKKDNRDMLLSAETIEQLFDLFENYVPKAAPKWINDKQI